MELIRTFEDLDRNDVAVAGGKGASLGELTRLGVPVPPGFVILTRSYEKFLAEHDILPQKISSILNSITANDISAVQEASEKILILFSTAGQPEFLTAEIALYFGTLHSEHAAVRSSATVEDNQSASWAGIFETYLNIPKAGLSSSIVRCWTSLYSPRAISYCMEKGLRGQDISVAVIIQKMVKSESSGTAFSVHPVMNDKNFAVIEAAYGLGESIVSGLITPDTYVIDKRTFEIVDIHITEQERGLFCSPNGDTQWMEIEKVRKEDQKLKSDEIIALTDLIIRIEHHYGVPVDIEWARENDQLYILQARPITSLKGTSL